MTINTREHLDKLKNMRASIEEMLAKHAEQHPKRITLAKMLDLGMEPHLLDLDRSVARDLNMEAEDEWLNTQTKGSWDRIRFKDHVTYWFTDSRDAVLFKLWFS